MAIAKYLFSPSFNMAKIVNMTKLIKNKLLLEQGCAAPTIRGASPDGSAV